MACKYNYNGEWLTEDQLRLVYQKQHTQENVPIQEEMLQKPELQSSKASPKTVEGVKEWLSRNNIDIRALDINRWRGVNGIANLLRSTIEIAEGKENVALPEEAMHFAVDMIKQNNATLYRQMFNKIGQYNIYQKTRELYADSPEYRNSDGTLNIPKIKEEAMGKLLAEYYIQKEELNTEKPEFLLQTKTWWETFVDWIKSLLGIAQFNPFEQAAKNLPEGNENSDAKIKELAELIQIQDVPSYMRDAIDQFFNNGQYREIVATIAEQLADQPTYEPTVRQYLGGDEALAQDILSTYQQFLQIEPKEPNQFADDLQKKLDDKITQFQLKKIVDDKAVQEDDRNYYEANIEGKPKRIGRTTEWAKKKNIQNTGGRDYFADLTPEQKAYYTHQATSGISGHFDIERIIKAALNTDGTLKPAKDVILNFQPMMSAAIFRTLREFLLGTDSQPGFIYQFEEGTKFRVEQQILNEKITTTNDKGERVRGRAGTIDLLVIQPTEGVVIYDWKFMGTKGENPQYVYSKEKQHQLQLADYKRTLKEGYGLKNEQIKAFTIPISAKITDVQIPSTKETIPTVWAVEIGNVNIKLEARPYLLPAVPDDQSTGNKHIDNLLSSLRAKYQRMYKKKVGGDEWYEKKEQLNELHNAIRNLQVAINFEPLSVDALNFKENINKLVEKYKNYDSAGKTIEEISPVLQELADAVNSASYYADVDEVFTSEYGDGELTEKNRDILTSLQQSSSAAKTASGKIQDIIGRIVEQKAIEEGVVNILIPQKEAKSITSTMLESGVVPIKSLQFLTKTVVDARSGDQIEAQRILEEFGGIYDNLTKLASSRGKTPLELISDPTEHALIRRVDRAVFADIKEAKNNRNKKAILDKIDVEKYKSLLAIRIAEKNAQIDDTTYSTDPAKNATEKKNRKIEALKTWDINRDGFMGWKNGVFGSLISKSLREEEFYSKEYKELLNPENKSALDMYNFIVGLNRRAKDDGYLGRKQGDRFLAFINATLVQRVKASSNKFKTFKEGVLDMFTVQEYEEQAYGKKDEETGQLDRSVPTYFTRELDKGKESKDLLSIIPLYIKALVHFETSQKLESLFQATLLMERNKGHLETEAGRVIFQGDSPKIYAGNSINAQRVGDYVDDQIYGINLQTDDLIARGIGKEEKALSAKKTLQATNRWVQQLAVGLKALVAIPNYIGAHLQETINAGNYYKSREYKSNHVRIIASALQSDVEKGLIDLIVPLNDENFAKGMRGIAWKQSARKWLSTISFQDFMMSTNRIPDVAHELTNALSWMENTMVVDGKLVNIRQYLRQQPEYQSRYVNPASLRATEEKFEEQVKELRETKALTKVAKFDSNDLLTIPGFDIKNSNLAEYRARVVEYGRNITSQLSRENKADYRRNIIANSFMMFKNWIVKQVQLRALDIHKNATLDDWEYGRARLFFKVWKTLGLRNIHKMRHLIKATPEGIEIMRQMYADKIEEYYKKTGEKLEITEAEFFDMIRKELRAEAKELAMLLSIVGAGFAIGAAAPPDDEEDEQVKNKWKLFARTLQKSQDELLFYYNPLSAESITRGTILPSLGLLTKMENLMEHVTKEAFGGPQTREKAHPLKYFFNLTPVASQFQNELLPIISPEAAKELGIKLSTQARAFR